MTQYTQQLVAVTKSDHQNNLWSIFHRGKQWYTHNNNNQLKSPLDSDYAAIITFDEQSKQPVSVSAPFDLDVKLSTILCHTSCCATQQSAAQIQLWTAASEISDPTLKSFLTGVLSDTSIMQSFYQAKASKSYHHKHEGELFIHSVEVAVNARMMAVQYNLPKRTQDCVFTGGLLHDIGKVLMHYNTGNDNKKGVNGQHESFSFMVLAAHLEELKLEDKSLFEAMSAMLSAQVANRKHYDYIEEAIVRSADRLSAHSYELGTAFKNKPADELFTSAHGGRKYKRLAPAQKIA